MILRSVRPETRASIEFRNYRNCANNMFRKLVLYPTELRGLSASCISQLTIKLHRNYTTSNDVSLTFTKGVGEIKGSA